MILGQLFLGNICVPLEVPMKFKIGVQIKKHNFLLYSMFPVQKEIKIVCVCAHGSTQMSLEVGAEDFQFARK